MLQRALAEPGAAAEPAPSVDFRSGLMKREQPAPAPEPPADTDSGHAMTQPAMINVHAAQHLGPSKDFVTDMVAADQTQEAVPLVEWRYHHALQHDAWFAARWLALLSGLDARQIVLSNWRESCRLPRCV